MNATATTAKHAATHAPLLGGTTPFDVMAVRRDFPALDQLVNGKPLVYLDNAATGHKPLAVLDALDGFYRGYNSNVHRGVHHLSQKATDAFEQARIDLARFIGAADHHELVFTRGTTDSINLVAHAWARRELRPGDEVLVTALEHHANIVPWQMLRDERGIRLVVAPIDDAGAVDMGAFEKLVGPRTRLVACCHTSNALGTVNPIARIAEIAHARGAKLLVDAAQAVPHGRVDVRKLGADFLAFSGHKMFGPTGIGVLWARRELLEAMPPHQGGGDMILSVSFERSTYNEVPYRFEAGTPHIAGAIGLAAAARYMDSVGLDRIATYEGELLAYATRALSAIPEVTLVGTAPVKASVLSFVMGKGIHPHDIGSILDQEGIAIRAGFHCAQPVVERLGHAATARASLAFYNTRTEVDRLVAGLAKVLEIFG